MNIFLLIVLLISLVTNSCLMRAIMFLGRRAEVGKRLRNSVNDCNTRLVGHWDEAREKALQFQKRVQQLEPALAECIAALEVIEAAIDSCSFQEKSNRRRNLAMKVLARIQIQIPDEELPTEGYPADGT